MRLVRSDNTTLFTKLVTDLEKVARNTVEVKSIAFERNEGVVDAIRVAGNAPSRSALVDFRDGLEAHDSFSAVELPLSNLAKDKDISFNIVITVANTQTQ